MKILAEATGVCVNPTLKDISVENAKEGTTTFLSVKSAHALLVVMDHAMSWVIASVMLVMLEANATDVQTVIMDFRVAELVTATLSAPLQHNATTLLASVRAGPIFEETNATVV